MTTPLLLSLALSTSSAAVALPDARTSSASAHVLTLAEALQSAVAHMPALRRAQANLDLARARVVDARSGYLPQVNANATAQRQTGSTVPFPGAPSLTYAGNYYSVGINANQLIYDFNTTLDRWRAAEASADAATYDNEAQKALVMLQVRQAFFTAREQRDLVGVARDNLKNTERHLDQTIGFVRVGTHPEVDLAQARTDRANALLQVIQTENNYAVAKAQLNQAMGVRSSIAYEVADDTLEAMPEEQRTVDALTEHIAGSRPDLVEAEKAIRAQELTVSSIRGNYGPALGVTAGASDKGPALGRLSYTVFAQIGLTWNLFAGLQTRAQVEEAEAQLAGLVADRDTLILSVRLEIEQALLAVRAAKASQEAAEEALVNARDRLRLAEGRYQAGVGNAIELGDAQVGLAQAQAQVVQARFNLSIARAQLLKALGRQ